MTKTKTMARPVSEMLIFDKMRMPFDTPVTAETMNPAVSTPIMTKRTVVPISRSVTIPKPSPIWSAAIPSEAAVPNNVAATAMMSIVRDSSLLFLFSP